MNVYGELKHAQIEVDDTAAHGGATTRPVGTKVYNSITHTAYISNGATWVLQTPVDVSSFTFVGEMKMMRGFNGLITCPRNWIPLTYIGGGASFLLNEANYNYHHGAGAWVADDIASSPIAGKYLPNINASAVSSGVFVRGAPNDSDGSSPDTILGSDTTNINHTHTTPNHSHRYMDTIGDSLAGNTWNSGGSTITSAIAANGTGSGSDVLGPKSDGVDAYTEVSGSGTTSGPSALIVATAPVNLSVIYIMRVK